MFAGFPFRGAFAAFGLCGAIVALPACGGSSSETPFPEEPLPAYLRRTPPKASASATSTATPSTTAPQAEVPQEGIRELPAPATWSDGKKRPSAKFDEQARPAGGKAGAPSELPPLDLAD